MDVLASTRRQQIILNRMISFNIKYQIPHIGFEITRISVESRLRKSWKLKTWQNASLLAMYVSPVNIGLYTFGPMVVKKGFNKNVQKPPKFSDLFCHSFFRFKSFRRWAFDIFEWKLHFLISTGSQSALIAYLPFIFILCYGARMVEFYRTLSLNVFSTLLDWKRWAVNRYVWALVYT